MRRLALIAGVMSILGGVALAQAPEQSLRPVARNVTPETSGETPKQETAKPERKGLFSALRPKKRGQKVRLFASKKRRALERGAVCGDTALQGVAVGRVPGAITGCGVAEAIKLRSVSGVALSQQSVMDCGTAQALKRWVDKGLKPSVGQRGGGVSKIKVAAHYACRTRNNQKGAKISEHGKGRAIDISAIFLADGSQLSVLKDWGKGWRGKALKRMHKTACGPFGTVLGPNANRFHRDHFHFDTARYRSGSYCR